MLPLQQAYEVKEAIYEFIQTTYRFKDQDVHKAFKEFIEDKKHGLVKGPYISLKAPFVSAEEGYEIPLDIAPGFPPYRHQIEAFNLLTTREGHTPQNTLITTGTGSGKTECFLYPILDYCFRNIGRKGIKVIILYPMNALATDQARRLAQAIYSDDRLRGNVTAGLFIGKGQDKKDFRTAMEEDGIIESREAIIANPPDILLTNFKMLDMGIMKAEYNNLWSYNTADPDVLQFLVLDELHTYDGAQGTDVANLIRRLKLRLGKGKGSLCGVGTSATIGSGEESKGLLCSYASDVFGEEFKTDNVIEEHRVPSSELFKGASDPFLPSQRFMDRLTMKEDETHATYIANQKKIWMFEPDIYEESNESVALTEHLSGYQITRDLFTITEEFGIIDCESLVEKISERNEAFNRYEPKYRMEILSSLLALIAEAKVRSGKITIPFLPLQVQLWIRELSGIRRIVAQEPKFTWKSDLTTKDEKTIALPMYYCRECGASGWVANKSTMQESFGLNGNNAAQMFMNHDGNSWIINTASEGHTPDESFDSFGGKLKPETLRILSSTVEDEDAFEFIACQKKEHGKNKTLHWCPECNSNKDDLAIVGSKSATLTSLAVSQVLSSNLDDASDKNRKILTFTNGVQDAAHLSSFIVARNFRFTFRASIQKVIEALEKEGKTPSLADVFERFTAYWKKECETVKAYLYRFFPPDYEGKIDLEKDYQNAGGDYKEFFLREFDQRIFWEIVSEFGFTSTVGRSLELTGSSAAFFRSEDISDVYERMKPWLEENNLQTVSLEDFGRFASGFLMRMRQHGGIDHPYLKKFRKDLRLWDLNWNRDNTHFLNRLFGPNSRRLKAFITYPAMSEDTRQNADTSYTNRSNWYFDYFKKCFPMAAAYAPLSNDFYKNFAEAMAATGILSRFEGSAGANYLIDPSRIFVTSDVRLIRCDKCQSAYYTSKEDRFASESTCIINRCTGSYSQEEEIEANYYQQIYKRERTPRIYSHEHTGLLDRKLRESIEVDFKERPEVNSINSLVATSTLEMGIDIGDLNAEINVSVPPLTSNYLQRVGRAGRKSGAALILDFAKNEPHDLFFFEDPQEMMAGRVNTPGCFLKAKDILKRHFYAYCLDCWTADDPVSNRIPSILQLLKLHTDFIPSAGFFINMISAYIKDHLDLLTDSFNSQYDEETVEQVLTPMYEQFRDGTFDTQLSITFTRLKRSHDELVSKIAAIKDEIKERNLSESDPACKSLKEQRKLLGSQLRKLRKRQVLEFMTDEGILPNYAFPETGVKLNANVLGNVPKGEEENKLPDITSFELVRPAGSGIVDLAPGNIFYFDGMKIKVDGLNTADWQSGKGLVKKRFCSECDCIIDDMPNHPAMCPKCGNPHFGSSDHTHLFVDLHEVKSNIRKKDSVIDDSSDDRNRKTYRKSFHFMFGSETSTVSFGMKDIPFGIEYVKNVRIFEANLGENTNDARSVEIKKEKVPCHGFVTCRYCGKSTSDPDAIMRKSNTDERRREWHYGYCKHREKEYTGKPDEFFEEVFLSREVQTEAIKILLPVQQIDSVATAAMFIAGLNLGLKYYFKGNPQHIRMREYAEYNDLNGRFDNYVVMYDTIPGGTGYLAKLFDTAEFTKVLKLAYEHISSCSCKDEGKDGCYHCILAYDNQYTRAQLSRQKAESLFKKIVDESDEWEEFNGSLGTVSGEGGIEESELEDKFISSLRELCPARGWQFTTKTDATYRYYQMDVKSASGEMRSYVIHPQRELGPAVDVEFNTRPDFILTCSSREANGVQMNASEILPIAIYLDGYTFHGKCREGSFPRFFDDYKKRDAIHRSRRFLSWTLSWEDLDLFADKAADSMFAPAVERIGQMWEMAELRKHINSFERLLYVLTDCGPDRLAMQNTIYFAAWSERNKYSNLDDYLGFRSEAAVSTNGQGFFRSRAGLDTGYAGVRVAVHGNAVKYGVKLTPVREDLDKESWNHFWRLYNMLNLSIEMDSHYPGEEWEDEISEENETDSPSFETEGPTKENTLYLPIKQVYFDQIIAGTKDKEYREIKEGITANRYLLKADNESGYALNPDCTDPSKKYFIDDYNDGKFPFLPKPIKYLSLAVGYAKERDTALVEVTGFSFEPNMVRSELYAFWIIAFHLGRVIEVHRK